MGSEDETGSPDTAVDGPGSIRRRRPKTDPGLSKGTLVDRYIVLEELGAGGMGVVYAAFDPELNRKIALKLVTSGDQERMLREAQAMARLSHPNVVAIHDVGFHQSRVFLAMELVEGITLSGWQRERTRSWRETVAIYIAAGRGLAAAHAAGIIHRDFKPSNVLVGTDGRARVLDFGLARSASEIPEPEPLARSSSRDLLGEQLTQAGSVLGTPVYMPPEAFRGESVGASGDQFSFCIALYEALYGERPFDDLWLANQPAPALRPAPAQSQVPLWLRKIIVRGLAEQVDQRFTSMGELIEALEADPAKTRRRLALGLPAVLGVGGLVAAGVMWRSGHANAPDPLCGAGATLAGVWDTDVRTRIKAAFDNVGGVTETSDFAHAAAALDEVSGRWIEARAQACADTRERHRQPEAVLVVRLSCLDGQKTQLASLVDLFEHPDAAIVEAAPIAVRQLIGPGACANARSLSIVELPPEHLRPDIAELRKAMAKSRALIAAAKPSDAVALMTPAVAKARTLGYPPVLAEALYDLELAATDAGDFQSLALLDEAERIAVANRLDVLVTRAAAAHYNYTAGGSSDPTDALADHARVWLTREPDLEAQYNFERGEANSAWNAGQHAKAMDAFERVANVASTLYGRDSITVLNANQNRAFMMSVLGRNDEAIELQKNAISVLDRLYGDDNDTIATALDNHATTLVSVGRYAQARAALERAGKMKTTSAGIRGAILCDTSRVLLAQGEIKPAIDSCEQGLAMLRKVETGLNLAINMDPLAGAYLAAKRYDDALVLSQTCVSEFHRASDQGSVDMVLCLAIEGTTLIELGRPAEAKPVLENALALQGSTAAAPGVVANLDYQLARALVASNGDRVRAKDLAGKAREELARLPFKKPLLDELDAWRIAAKID